MKQSSAFEKNKMTMSSKSLLSEVLPRSVSFTVDWVNGLMTIGVLLRQHGDSAFFFLLQLDVRGLLLLLQQQQQQLLAQI